VVAALNVEEKELLVHGSGMWTTAGVERLGIPPLCLADGPAGARGVGLLASGTPTLCIPCGSALGATWNPDLVERLGRAVAEEARAKRMHVLLAPTVNLHRTPLGGRNFECYSEDPWLSGKLAAGFVRGVQSGAVATTVKHLVANDSEYERTTISSVVDPRTLREVSLLPFELAVTEGGAWGLMAAYNRLNGTYCAEHAELIGIARQEWGFDGVVVSDWYATRSTAPSANAGLDLEMPGPGRFFAKGRLTAAVGDGAVDPDVLAAMVDRLLTLRERTRAAELPPGPEGVLDRPEHRALARRAAAEATVLLKNDGLLPLDVGRLRRVAVIGPNAQRAEIMGGGSAALRPYHRTSPLAALRRRMGDRLEVTFERGCDTDRSATAVAAPFEVELFAGAEWPPSGPSVATDRFDTGWAIMSTPPLGVEVPGDAGAGVDTPVPFSARARARIVAEESGRHELTLSCVGRARLWLGDDLVIDAFSPDLVRGEELFGLAFGPFATPIDLAAGQAVDVTVEYSSEEAVFLYGFVVGLRPPPVADLMERAVAAAAGADAAVVVVGTSADWETEGRDRETFELPGGQDELVARVAAANPRTVVVLNAGAPVATDWVDDVGALLQVWLGGQEMADALVDVLVGDQTPSGKLPTTFPVALADTPSFLNWPGENSEVRYGEGLFVGHRFYEATGRTPRFSFGHGLSYTTFEIGRPEVAMDEADDGPTVTLRVEVTNTGQRRGAETLQCYVAPPATTRLRRPPRELRGFAKVWLDPGERATAEIVLPPRCFSYFDPGDPDFEALATNRMVEGGEGHAREPGPGWHIDPGPYRLDVATSADRVAHAVEVAVERGVRRPVPG